MTKVRPLPLLVLVMSMGMLTHWVAFHGPQVIDGPDIKIHFRWALQFAAALSEGVLYPRWASYSYFGLGDPTFLYMHPLFYYAVAAFNAVTGSLWTAILAVGAMSTAATVAVTYWFSRKYTTATLAVAAGAAMAVSPYAFHLAHYQQFLPMHFAMPMLVLYLGIVSSVSSQHRVPLTAVSLALLVMSHVLAAFMALICTSTIVLWRALRERNTALRLVIQHGLGVLLGLALSAIYLLPALTTQQLVSPAGWYAPVHLDWRNAFLFQYLTLPATGFRWFHLQWTIPLLTVLACSLAGVFLWLAKSKSSDSWQRALEMLTMALLALLLGSEISYPLWEHIGILRRLQFPLRFLQIACVASVFALAWSAACVVQARRKMVWMMIGAFLIGSTAMLGALERQYAAEAKPALTVAAPGIAQRGQPEMKPATAGDAWRKYLDQGGWEADCSILKLSCTRSVAKTHHKVWVGEATADIQGFRLPMFWFPGWEFLVNGEAVTPSVDQDTGLPMIALKPGNTTVEARWRGLPQERNGAAISLMALLTTVWLLYANRNRGLKRNSIHVA